MNIELFVALVALVGLLGSAYYIKNYTVPKKNVQATDQPVPEKTQNGEIGENGALSNQEPVEIVPMSYALGNAMRVAVEEMSGYCQAIAYVDTNANRLIGAYSKIAFPNEIVSLVASTTTDLFNLPNLVKVANAFKVFKGQNLDESNFDAMWIRGMGTIYIFVRAKSNVHRVCVFACVDPENDHNNNNFGLLLRQIRLHLPQIEVAAEAAFLAE